MVHDAWALPQALCESASDLESRAGDVDASGISPPQKHNAISQGLDRKKSLPPPVVLHINSKGSPCGSPEWSGPSTRLRSFSPPGVARSCQTHSLRSAPMHLVRDAARDNSGVVTRGVLRDTLEEFGRQLRRTTQDMSKTLYDMDRRVSGTEDMQKKLEHRLTEVVGICKGLPEELQFQICRQVTDELLQRNVDFEENLRARFQEIDSATCLAHANLEQQMQEQSLEELRACLDSLQCKMQDVTQILGRTAQETRELQSEISAHEVRLNTIRVLVDAKDREICNKSQITRLEQKLELLCKQIHKKSFEKADKADAFDLLHKRLTNQEHAHEELRRSISWLCNSATSVRPSIGGSSLCGDMLGSVALECPMMPSLPSPPSLLSLSLSSTHAPKSLGSVNALQ